MLLGFYNIYCFQWVDFTHLYYFWLPIGIWVMVLTLGMNTERRAHQSGVCVKRSPGDKGRPRGRGVTTAQEMKRRKMKLKVSNAPERASQDKGSGSSEPLEGVLLLNGVRYQIALCWAGTESWTLEIMNVDRCCGRLNELREQRNWMVAAVKSSEGGQFALFCWLTFFG